MPNETGPKALAALSLPLLGAGTATAWLHKLAGARALGAKGTVVVATVLLVICSFLGSDATTVVFGNTYPVGSYFTINDAAAPPICAGVPRLNANAVAYDTPASWTTRDPGPPISLITTDPTPGIEPLNVIISGCSTVTMGEIRRALRVDFRPPQQWDAVGDVFGRLSPCQVSRENANVTGGGYVHQDLSLRLDGCAGATNYLAEAGLENHARLWQQPRSDAWFATLSYETLCKVTTKGLEPADALTDPIVHSQGVNGGWHCVDGGPGSHGTNGYDRGAQDFVAQIEVAAKHEGWYVTLSTTTLRCTDDQGKPVDCPSGRNKVPFSTTVYVLEVDKTPSPLTISTTSLPTGQQGSQYSTQVVASGGTGTYSWAALNLPAGLAIDNNGDISGTPIAGTYAFNGTPQPATVQITVTDNLGQQASATLDLTIAPLPPSTATANPHRHSD